MSKRKEKEDIKMTIFIMVVGIASMVLGVFGIVTSRIEKKEYVLFFSVRRSHIFVALPRHTRRTPSAMGSRVPV